MRIGISTSRIRHARKLRAFGATPDFISGAAAVLATFAFQAFFHRPSATLSSSKTNILLPAVPQTPTSPLPPSKITIPAQNQNASMCTLAAGGLVVLIVLAASAARVFHYSTPTRRRHSFATSHGDGGDDPDPTPPPRTCPDDTDDAQDTDTDDEAEVEALLTGDALEMDAVEDLLVVDDDGEEDPNDPPPPDDPPPPASTTATPDDRTPPRARVASLLRLWLAALCAALADSLTHALADWLRQKALAPLVDAHHRLRLRGVLVTNIHPRVLPRALYDNTTPADSVRVPPSPTTAGLTSNSTTRAIYRATNLVPPTLRAQRTQHAPPSMNVAPHAKLILMVGAVLGNVCALVVTVLYRFSWRERKEKGECVPPFDDELVRALRTPLPEDHEDDFNLALWIPLPEVDER
ncbi:hypothetical protein C0992_006289, partial [Termitomyces sp. T32_za158]